MTPHQKMVEEFRQFYFKAIKPDYAYVVVAPQGGTRFSMQRITAQYDVSVVSTASGGMVPLRDSHIYRVVEPGPDGNPGVPDAVVEEVAKIAHRSMCGVAKLGKDITLGEIGLAAEAQVLARSQDRFHEAPMVSPIGSAGRDNRPEMPGIDSLPLTAVQICIGDRVYSMPFETPEEAKASDEWFVASNLPEVVTGQAEVWLRDVHPESEDA